MTNNFEEFRIWGFRVVYGGERFWFERKSEKQEEEDSLRLLFL